MKKIQFTVIVTIRRRKKAFACWYVHTWYFKTIPKQREKTQIWAQCGGGYERDIDEIWIMNGKHINLILSNISQRSHCIVLKHKHFQHSILSSSFMKHHLNVELCGNCLWIEVIIHFVLFQQYTANIIEKIWVGNEMHTHKRCFYANVLFSFIVLWYAEIFLNAILMTSMCIFMCVQKENEK